MEYIETMRALSLYVVEVARRGEPVIPTFFFGLKSTRSLIFHACYLMYNLMLVVVGNHAVLDLVQFDANIVSMRSRSGL